MRVLLDECLPRKLKHDIRADFVRTVPEMGWASVENGALLNLAQGAFDVFITRDRNLAYQQNLQLFDLAVIVLVAPSNDIDDLRPLMNAMNETIPNMHPHEVKYISR